MFVSEFSVWVKSAHERYSTYKKKLEQSKNDPPNDPYRSKYEARNILNQLNLEIERSWISYGNIQVKLLYALFNHDIGLVFIDTDETQNGIDALEVSWKFIYDFISSAIGCHLAIKILNQLAISWSERGENEKALDYLLQAESLYNTYKSSNEVPPYDSEDMFMLESTPERNWTSFEITFTLTLYYMAQVYGLMDEDEKSAACCKETLKRQRVTEYQSLDWGLNCATLSQFYIKNNMFEEARHLLCCSTESLKKRESELKEENTDEERNNWHAYHQAKATLACFIIKYSIAVLRYSSPNTNTGDQQESIQKPAEVSRLTDENAVLEMEEKILIRATCFEEAKDIFLFAVSHIAEAKSFYALNRYASNYVQIVRDHSCLYKYLANFEHDLSRHCKMLKRRIDMLEEVLHQLNPQFYLSICRQLQFELGEIYLEMMDSKFKIAQACADNLGVNTVKKINSIITQGINHFSAFIKSFQDAEGKNPDKFPKDNVRPVLVAYFYLGRFYSKLVESDTNRKVYNLMKSEECYKTIVNYIEKNPNQASYVTKELPVAKEMVELMPQRMAQVTGSTIF